MKFLSRDWLAALAAQAEALEPLDADAPSSITIEFRVDDVRFHLCIAERRLHFVPGEAPSSDVAFTFAYAIAQAIAKGELSAQSAFMSGSLSISGDSQALVRNAVALSRYRDLVGSLRDETEF